jgi:hypothetical protein
MQPHEVLEFYRAIKSAAEQSDVGFLKQETLAILAVGCVIDDCSLNIEQSLDSQGTR